MALVRLLRVASLLSLLAPGCRSQLAVCGKPALNSRIVGGQVAPDGRWPWQVSIHKNSRHLCGGSLINSQWVLSAAHCFKSASLGSLRVYLGRQSQEGSNPNEVSRGVAQVIQHPAYNNKTLDNDVALLKLTTPVSFTTHILPICLAANDSVFHSGTATWVTGWGHIAFGVMLPSPKNLMEVEVPVVGNRQCNCDLGVGGITVNMICAGLRAGGKDSCQGDSGGPMVSKQSSRWVQAGVVSFGDKCAKPNSPGVYARVSQYQTWINGHIVSDRPGYVTFTSSGTDSDLSVSCRGLPELPTTTTAPPTTTTAPPTTTTTPTATTTAPSTTTTAPPTTTTAPPTTTTAPPTTTAQAVVCGRAPLNPRVLGGSSVAAAGVWPWMASLQKNGSHVCGGTLVGVDAVLSAASCFSSSPAASDWTVVLGLLTLTGSNPLSLKLNATNVTLSRLNGSNVAVVHLQTPPTLSNYIQPICLGIGRSFSVGTTCWVAGWSSAAGGGALQEVQTSVSDCGNASASDSLCTESVALAVGASGGPLMCRQDGAWFQAAVLSAGTSSRRARAAVSVFTKLDRFSSFLSDTLGALLSPEADRNSTNSTAPATTATTATSTTSSTSSSSGALTHLLLLLSLSLLLPLR